MAKHATSYVCELCPALNVPNASGSTVLPLTSGIGLVAVALAREHNSLGIAEHRWEADVPIKT